MKRILWSMAFFGLCLTAPVCLVRAQTPLQIAPDQAVGVLSEDPSSGERWSTSIFPFGNYVGLDSGEDVFCRTYLRFPLDTIPVSAIVQSATLHVYVDDYWPAPGSAPMSVYPVAAAWTPDSVDWYDIGDWPTLGAAVATTVVSSTMGWYGWDVTSLVQGWVDGAPNRGLAVAAADLGSTASNWAAARRLTAGDPATRPYLEVIFSEPTPTPSPPPPTATATPSPPPPTATATRKPSQPTTPQPAAPTATPIPTVTPTPELVLLPITGGGLLAAGAWTLLVGGGLGLLAGLAGAVSRSLHL